MEQHARRRAVRSGRAGTLHKDGELERQVQRLLDDPKSQALVENFAGQWLQLRNLKTSAPDKDVFPAFDETLRAAMATETEMFFAEIMREDRSVLEFLDADYTFVNERLARHYGLPDVKGNEFRKVALNSGQRGGVLDSSQRAHRHVEPHADLAGQTGQVDLGEHPRLAPPPPPPNVPPLAEESAANPTASLRERMQVHRAKAECAGCHNRMDPLGFGLENFDGVGAWRTEDAGFKIDPGGVLPGGQSFAGPAELKGVLKLRQDEFLRCLAEKMLTYGLGRGVEYSDRCTVADVVKSVRENDFNSRA